MELTPQQQDQILSQLNRPGWKITGQRPETTKVSGRDENNQSVTVDQPTGNIVLVITGPTGQSDEVTVKPPSTTPNYPGPWSPTTNDVGPYAPPNPNPTIVKGPQGNVQAPPQPNGWADQLWVKNADGSSTLYGRDPKDGVFKQVPNVPQSAAPASTTKAPSDPSKWVPILGPDGKPIAMQDPATGDRVAVPQGAEKSPSGSTKQTIEGGRTITWTADGNGNWNIKDIGQPIPAANQPTEGQTRQSVISGTNYVGQETYHNGVWSLDPNFTPKPYVPTDKPSEGDVRPNVVGGQSVQEIYKGGSWVVDTSVAPKPFVPQPPTTINPGTGPNIVQQNPQTGAITTLPNPNTTDVGARVSQLQQQAQTERDTLNQQIASGQKSQDQANSEFNSWWDTNIAPYTPGLQQQQAAVQQDQQLKANADQRAAEAQRQSSLSTAQTAGQQAVSNVMQILPNMHSQKFLDQYAAALNGVARGSSAGVNFTPDAFAVQAPDLNAIAQDATAKALAHISPTAANIAGQQVPQVPQGLDIASALNRSTYAPTTTISPDGTVTIQHSPQQPTPFQQSGATEGAGVGSRLAPALSPDDLLGTYQPSL